MNHPILLAFLILTIIYCITSQLKIEKFTDIYEPSTYQSEQILKQIYYELPPECKSTLNSNAINRIVPVLKSLSFVDLKNDLFYHVGSGCGRSVLEFWLKTGISSKGIDTEESRLDISKQALSYLNSRTDLIPKTYLPPHNAIEFANSTIPSNDANLVYIEKMTPNTLEQILRLPNLKVIMFSGPCPPKLSKPLHMKFPKHTTSTIPHSWADDQELHIFHL